MGMRTVFAVITAALTATNIGGLGRTPTKEVFLLSTIIIPLALWQ
jgi:hypothetical protein